jgi:NAD(P)-dependent dehydrogenase (short-subunit alcohol dehydrogenase family)
VLNVLADPYPTRLATSATPRSCWRSKSFATAIRQASKYSIGATPTVRVKRSKTKMAIAGFTASLALELEEFNVRVKLVEPGYGPTTRFTSNGGQRTEGLIPEEYAPYANRIFAAFGQTSVVTTERDVAMGVWRAANDETGQLRFRVVRTPWRWLNPESEDVSPRPACGARPAADERRGRPLASPRPS